jgi:hypothetical protein
MISGYLFDSLGCLATCRSTRHLAFPKARNFFATAIVHFIFVFSACTKAGLTVFSFFAKQSKPT